MDHATFPGNSSSSLSSTKFTMSPAAHTIHRAMDSLKLLWAFRRSWWKSPSKMESRGTTGFLHYHVTPISSTIPSPLEALTGRKLRTSLPQIPSSIGKTVESSRICQELIKCQPSTSTSYSMDLEPGQPVFVKEVHGNIWKTGTIDQPAREPDSYWVRFPDDSILRRTCQMIKPRSLPSHFELETQSSERNMQEYRTSSNSAEFPDNVPRHRTASLTDRQSGCTSIPWNRRHQLRGRTLLPVPPKFLWCDTTFHSSSSEEISPFYKGCSTQEILSFERVTVHVQMLSVWTIWTFGTQ